MNTGKTIAFSVYTSLVQFKSLLQVFNGLKWDRRYFVYRSCSIKSRDHKQQVVETGEVEDRMVAFASCPHFAFGSLPWRRYKGVAVATTIGSTSRHPFQKRKSSPENHNIAPTGTSIKKLKNGRIAIVLQLLVP